MLPYWFFFSIPFFTLLSSARLNERTSAIAWALVWLFFSVVIGYRLEVGGDWFTYLMHFEHLKTYTFAEVLNRDDPGYYLVNWIIGQVGGDIYLVNFVCGAIVMAGVVNFSRSQPLPWLALLVAVPYLIIVVAMGYTRQSAALGFLLLGLAALGSGKNVWFVVWVMLGASFHKSAVLMLPIAALSSTTNRFWSLFWVGTITAVGGYLFLFDSVDRFWTNYVEADYHSRGGLIRVLMNAVPAALFMIFSNSLRLNEKERRLWTWMAIFSLACIPLVLLSSTATDRVALYLIPIQLFVFSRLPFIANDARGRGIVTLGVMVYYTLALAAWLTLANHAFAWLPYKFSPFY